MVLGHRGKLFEVSVLPVRTLVNTQLKVWLKQQLGLQVEIHLYSSVS